MDLTNASVKDILDKGRTHHQWQQDKAISDDVLKKLYDHTKMGPTSANCSPLRVVYIRSPEAKEKLKSTLFEGNIEQTMSAPVTVIFAYDRLYYDKLTTLYPVAPTARQWFEGPESDEIAVRNSSLQAAYFMLVARDYGLDCGPMSGFDRNKVRDLFLANTTWETNFLCNLGYGLDSAVHPRLPRLSFDEACQLV